MENIVNVSEGGQMVVPKPQDPEFAKGGGLAEMASLVEVEDQGSYDMAHGFLVDAKRLLKHIDTREEAVLGPFRRGLEAGRAFFKELRAPLETAERVLKGKMVAFHDAEQKKAEAAERQRRKDAEKEQQRLRDEAAARERQAEQEAEAARKRGDSGAAMAAQTQAQQAREEQNAPLPAVLPAAASVPKAAGTSMKALWKFEVVDLPALIKAAGEGHPLAVSCVQANETAIGQLARAQKEQCRIPGVKVWSETSMSARATK